MDNFINKIKSNFGKAKDEAEKYTKIAAKKTSSIIDKTKYSIALNDAENKIASVMAEIGEYVYAEYVKGAEFPDEIAGKCSDIDALKEEIASLKAKIAELKDSAICSTCGEYNPVGNEYCGKCGEKLN